MEVAGAAIRLPRVVGILRISIESVWWKLKEKLLEERFVLFLCVQRAYYWALGPAPACRASSIIRLVCLFYKRKNQSADLIELELGSVLKKH